VKTVMGGGEGGVKWMVGQPDIDFEPLHWPLLKLCVG